MSGEARESPHIYYKLPDGEVRVSRPGLDGNLKKSHYHAEGSFFPGWKDGEKRGGDYVSGGGVGRRNPSRARSLAPIALKGKRGDYTLYAVLAVG